MNILRKRIEGLIKKQTPLLLNNNSNTRIPSSGLFIPSASSSFDPESIPNMVGWWEADYGVTLNGSTVSRWDQKGSGTKYFIQNTATNQPTYTTNAINGLPALTFDGTNDALSLNTTITGLSNMTFLVVYKRAINTNQCVLFGDNNTYPYLQYGSSFLVGNASKSSAMTNDVWYLRSGTGSGVNNEWFSNGVSLGTAATAGAFSYFNSVGFPGNGATINGQIYGLMFFDRVLTSDELNLLSNYFNDKLSIY